MFLSRTITLETVRDTVKDLDIYLLRKNGISKTPLVTNIL